MTPNACSRSSPEAIFGRAPLLLPGRCRADRHRAHDVHLAWQAPPLQPERWISSRIAAAAESGRPAPPYLRNQRQRKPDWGERIHELVGYADLAVEGAPASPGSRRRACAPSCECRRSSRRRRRGAADVSLRNFVGSSLPRRPGRRLSEHIVAADRSYGKTIKTIVRIAQSYDVTSAGRAAGYSTRPEGRAALAYALAVGGDRHGDRHRLDLELVDGFHAEVLERQTRADSIAFDTR